MRNDAIFEIVLKENQKYIDLINKNSTAIEQEIQLQICSAMFKSLILETGLINEYATYCNIQNAKRGR